jgi:hypothetical protein
MSDGTQVTIQTEVSVRRGPRRGLRRASSQAVTAFLGQLLSQGPVAVVELEQSARDVGLLGKRQRITDAKGFKRAKKLLAVQSYRSGFGRGGKWFWRLLAERKAAAARPALDQSVATLPLVAYGERHTRPEQRPVLTATLANRASAPVEALRKHPVPHEWVRGVALLHRHARPSSVPQHRWQLFLDDCARFLDASDGWAERAARLGWGAEALFGCDQHRPLDQPGAGLLWRVVGGRLTALYRTWAVVEINGAQHIVHRRPATPGRTLPWSLR